MRTVGLDDRRILLGLLLLATCLYSLLARDSYGGDFRAYYVAAQASHAGLDPYLNQVNVDERYADGAWLQVNSRFIYPPSSLFLFAPLARLPYRVAKVVWGTLMAALMVWILMALRDQYPSAGWMAAGLFLSLPMAANVDNGQVDVLILGLTLMVLLAKRPWVGGMCLGVAIAVKFAPILVIPWLLAKRRWKTAAWAVATAAIVTSAAIGVWGIGAYRESLDHLEHHLGPHPAMLSHVFTGVHVLYGRFVVMGWDTYSLHYFYGTRQNPLMRLGSWGPLAGICLVLGFEVWLFVSPRGRRLGDEASLFSFLAVALFANTLLWPAGLVACFPLTMLLVARSSKPVGHGLAMLAPLFLPVEVVMDQRFCFWLVAVGWCLWENRRERVQPAR